MICILCNLESNFKCPIDKSLFCQNHKDEHQLSNHRCESLEIQYSREEHKSLNQTLLNHISKLRSEKVSINSNCNYLIKRIENLRSQTFSAIEKIIFSYTLLIRQKKYSNTDKKEINDIMNFTFDIKKLQLGPGLNIPETLLAELSDNFVIQASRPEPVQFNDLNLESKKKALNEMNFQNWNPSSVNQNLIKEIRKSNDSEVIFICMIYSGKFN